MEASFLSQKFFELGKASISHLSFASALSGAPTRGLCTCTFGGTGKCNYEYMYIVGSSDSVDGGWWLFQTETWTVHNRSF